jgi:hypothetical protein
MKTVLRQRELGQSWAYKVAIHLQIQKEVMKSDQTKNFETCTNDGKKII